MLKLTKLSFAALLGAAAPCAMLLAPATAQAAPATYAIKGTVAGPGGTTITLAGAGQWTLNTSAAGTYAFTMLVDGKYSVQPSRPGYVFFPASQEVDVNGGIASGVNFAAVATSLPT